MKYKIVCRNSEMLLEEVVSKYIADGWRPQGGVSSSGDSLFQAMIFPITIYSSLHIDGLTKEEAKVLAGALIEMVA